MLARINPNKFFAAIFVFAAFLRFYEINTPLVETYNNMSRQAISATIARNFYQKGFHFFYPEIDENGRGPYLFQGEMPIYSFLMALGYWLAGGAQEGVARAVSVLFSLGTIAVLYALTKRLYSALEACVACALFSFSPLSLALSRSVQPEASMIFFSILCLYSFLRYQESLKNNWLFLTALSFFLAIGAKFYNIYLWFPLLAIAFQREKWRLFTNGKNYALSLFAFTALIWYGIMWNTGRHQHLAYIVYRMNDTRGPADMSYWQILFSPHYLGITGKIFFLHLLTPLGFILLLGNIFRKYGGRSDHILAVWAFSSVALMLVFWRTVIDHSYYQLPLILPFAVLAGRGVRPVWEAVRRLAPALRMALITGLAAAQLFVCGYLYHGLYFIPESRWAIVHAGQAVQRLTPKDALVLASFQTSSIQLYYCNRKGWAFNSLGTKDELIARFEEYREMGAEFFVISTPETFKDHPEFGRHLSEKYRLVEDAPNYRVYDLRMTPRP